MSDTFNGGGIESSSGGLLSRRAFLQASGTGGAGLALSGLAPIQQPVQPDSPLEEPQAAALSDANSPAEYTEPPKTHPVNMDTSKYCRVGWGLEGPTDVGDVIDATYYGFLGTIYGFDAVRAQCTHTSFFNPNHDTTWDPHTFSMINAMASVHNYRLGDGHNDKDIALDALPTNNFWHSGNSETVGIYATNSFLTDYGLNLFSMCYDTLGRGKVDRVLYSYPWIGDDVITQTWDSPVSENFRKGAITYYVGGEGKTEAVANPSGLTLIAIIEGKDLDQINVHSVSGSRVNGPANVAGNKQLRMVYFEPLRPFRPYPAPSPMDAAYQLWVEALEWAVSQWDKKGENNPFNVPGVQITQDEARKIMEKVSIGFRARKRYDKWSRSRA